MFFYWVDYWHDVLIVFTTVGIFYFTYRVADYTKQLVNENTATAAKELRPYVGFEDIYFIFKHDKTFDGEMREFSDFQKIRFFNFGRTPAVNVELTIRRTATMPNSIPNEGPDYAHRILPPGQRWGVRRKSEPGITHKDKFFTWGWISYQDIEGHQWTTEFAWVYEPESPESPEGRGEFTTAYGDYNKEYKGKKRQT